MFSAQLRAIWNAQNRGRPIGDVPQRRDWFQFENKADSTDLYIYDAIYPDDGLGAGGIGAISFQEQLNAVKSGRINLYLNSPGGLVDEGLTIYNALRTHPATVNVVVQGIAASIATVIAQAGDRVEMAPGSMMMIHEAYGFSMGTAGDMARAAAMLEKMTASIAGIYALRSGRDAGEWLPLMAAETWFNDQETVDAGLADGLVGRAGAAPAGRNERATSSGEDEMNRRRLLVTAQMEVIHAYAAGSA